ncbi:MAG: pitrilysin family protein [Betaproteobacteria bacterium]|jgi:zinc protease
MKWTKEVKEIVIYITACVAMLYSLQGNAALPIQKIQLDTGATLLFVEARTIPIIDIGIDFVGGVVRDPKGKIGTSAMTASLLNKGSVIDGKVLNEADTVDSISDLAATVNFSSSVDSSSMRIRSLSKAQVLEPLITQVQSMLANPIFDSKILEREKILEINALKDSDSKPNVMVSKQFRKMIYKNNPLGNEETVNSIQAIQVTDLKKFHQNYYQAKNANVLIVGDINKEKAIQIGMQLTEKLPKGNDFYPEVFLLERSPVAPLSQREVTLSNPSQQAHIQMGMTGIARNDPDYYSLLVGNYILGGGGFVSRLMTEIREKRGLAYSVSSYFYPGKNSGIYLATMQTRKDQANQAVQLMRESIQEFIQNGPSDSEVEGAKNNLTNGFALRIDSNRKLLENISSIAWNDLPLDTLDTWTASVQQVSKSSIKEAFKKHLDMERMVTVVVGEK